LTFHRATCTFIFPISIFFGEAALHLYRITCTFNLFVSALRQEKKRRRVLKSAGKLSTQDLSWLLAFKMTRQQQQLLQNYMSH